MVARQASTLKCLSVAGLYMLVSVMLVVLNKQVLTDHKSPVFTTWYQCMLTALIGVPFSGMFKSETGFVRAFNWDWKTSKTVGKLTAIFVIMLCTNNLSLQLVSVSFYPVARSLSVLFTLIIERHKDMHAVSIWIILSCAVVMTGFFVGANGQLNLDLRGLFWGVVASLFVSLYGVAAKSALDVVGSSWRLMLFNNVNATFMLLPVVFATGALGYYGDSIPSGEFPQDLSAFASGQLMLSGAAGFSLSLATFMLIDTTTPLTHLISGTTKNAVLELVSILHLNEEVTSTSLLGIVLNLGGAAWYGILRFREKQAREKRQE